MASSVVFISYRREDSAGYAGRLFDRLVARLGRDHVFRDIEDIAPGDDFVDSIRQLLTTCDVLLVIIGPRWLTATDQEGRKRLEDSKDLVRAEIEQGLERKIRIIPVLLPGTSMPSENDLPAVLAPIAQFNAMEIRESSFEHDVEKLIEAMGRRHRRGWRSVTRASYVYPSLIGAALVLSLAWFFWPNPQLFMTPERARLRLTATGLNYDANTFVRRANEGDSEAVKLFLRAGMSPDKTPFQQTAIVAAAEEGHLAVVKALAEAGANVNPALVAAGRGKNKAVLDYLLSRDPKKESIAGALYVAAGEGNRIDFVRDLLDRGVDVDAEWGGKPLMSAAYYGRLDILELLVKRGANVRATSDEGQTALHYAARSGSPSPQIVGALLNSGAPINAQDQEGTTALMSALESREVAKLLLTRGADVTLRTKDGATALLYAAGRNVPWLIKPLIERGADVNARNGRGQTPLMWATGAIDWMDKPEVMHALIDSGADVNLADRDGNTALMFAALQGLTNSASILLQAHAQTAIRNKGGQTALDIAKKASREGVVKLLSGAH